MALNPDNVIIGPAYVEFRGVDLGFTSDDGVEPNLAAVKNVYFKGAQSLVDSKAHRERVDATISAEFHELTLANMRYLMDIEDAPADGVLNGSWSPTPTEGGLVLTMPGSGGSTRVLTATAVVDSVSAGKFSNGVYYGVKVTFKLLGDPEANQLWSIDETAASTTVPAVASYQKLVSGSPTTITDGATAVEIGAALQVTLNVPIRPDQLTKSNFILKLDAGNTEISYTLAFATSGGATDYTKVILTPAASMATTTAHELYVPAGLRSFDGLRSAAGAGIQFTTGS